MKDIGNDLTEEMLAELEGRIKEVYQQAYDDLDKEVKDYFEKFVKRDAEMKRQVETGEVSKDEYKRWRLTQMGRGQRFEALRDKMAQRVTEANEVAVSYVNDATPGIYSLNRNYEAYQIEKTVGNCDFTLFDESTVRRLIVEQPDLMPYYPSNRAVRRGIDLAYGKSQITKQVTSGILRGISPGKIANELMDSVTGMSRESAVRAARTGVTAAQNAGRMDSYVAAEKMGIMIRRRWIATKDMKTRSAHGMADGQIVEGTDTPFEVGGEKLMFPCDTSCGASGHNIYNCRCRMRTVEKDGIEAEPRQMRVKNPVTGKYELVNEMTYQEWAEWKNPGISQKTVANSGKSDTIKLGDIHIGKSLGAKAKNYDVLDLETGEYFKFVEGTSLRNVEVFAGKGTKSVLRIADKYAERYGGNPEDWQHVKGHGVLATDDGDMKAEVHWMQCEGFGKHDFFVKKWED